MKADVIMGGPGREAPVSRISGAAVARGLRAGGWDVAEVDLADRLDPGALRAGSVIMNLVHGTYGEDGQLQRELETAGIAYLGSDAACSALCMDKEATKQRLRQHDLPVPWGLALDPTAPPDLGQFRFPTMTGMVIKPQSEGSSVGLYLISSPSFLIPALERYLAEVGPRPLLVEERLPGPEYTVAIIDRGVGPEVLPPLQIVPAGETYDYHAKYEAEDTGYRPVEETDLAARLQELAHRSWEACGCRDLARIDLMVGSDGEVKVLEVNTLPGFTDHSLVPKAAQLAGIDFEQLVDALARRVAGRMEQR